MTTPHPTPEERYEAAGRRSESRFKGGGSAAYMLDVRNEIITAIREAEAAGEARGRAMAIAAVEYVAVSQGHAECCGCGICIGGPPECCGDPLYMISDRDAIAAIRSRTDKEPSDD